MLIDSNSALIHLSSDPAACRKLLHPLLYAWVSLIAVVEVGQLGSSVCVGHHPPLMNQGVAGVLLALQT